MSRENVEVVRQHIEAFRASDREGALSWLDPHIVFDVTSYAAVGEIVVGHGAIDRFARRFRGTFEGYDYEIGALRDLGGGTVLCVGTERGRGRASGVSVERPFAGLYSVIRGRIVRLTMFTSEAEALEAVGLRE